MEYPFTAAFRGMTVPKPVEMSGVTDDPSSSDCNRSPSPMSPILIGEWWVTAKWGAGVAHRVGSLIPDLGRLPDGPDYDYTRWIPLCACDTLLPEGGRREAAALHSARQQETNARCSQCEVRSPAFDRWLESSSFPPRTDTTARE